VTDRYAKKTDPEGKSVRVLIRITPGPNPRRLADAAGTDSPGDAGADGELRTAPDPPNPVAPALSRILTN
jgi:hypothetical protein